MTVAGVSINPTAFLVVQSNVVKLLPVEHSNTIDKLLDYVPDLIEKANCMMDKCIKNKKDLGEKLINNIKKNCKQQEKEEKNDEQSENDNIKVEEIKEKIEIEEDEEQE